MKQMQQIANIVNTAHRIVALETTRCDTVVSLFKQYCQQSQIPVFFWAEGQDLTRLGNHPVAISATQTPDDIIKFIHCLPYFGVFLLQDFLSVANSDLKTELHKLASSQRAHALKIILLGAEVTLDESLHVHTLIVECHSDQHLPHATAPPLAVGKRLHTPSLGRKYVEGRSLISGRPLDLLKPRRSFLRSL